MWFDETGLQWVRPSPNLPTLTSALIYPALVAFEGTNVSVGRGTADAFQRFGAPWMNAQEVASLLNGRRPPGVRFDVDSFTPVNPGDGKYGGKRIPGIRVVVTDRNAVQPGHLSAQILWALSRVNRDSLRFSDATFDERFGSSATAAGRARRRGSRPCRRARTTSRERVPSLSPALSLVLTLRGNAHVKVNGSETFLRPVAANSAVTIPIPGYSTGSASRCRTTVESIEVPSSGRLVATSVWKGYFYAQ